MLKYYLLIALLLTVAIADARTQEYNLENDTIRVSMSKGAVLLFPGELEYVSQTCSDYSYAIGASDLTVRVRGPKPKEPFCAMIVREGAGGDRRQHQLVIQYVDIVPVSEQVHDYSTKEKIAQRIARNADARTASASNDAPESRTGTLPVFSASLAGDDRGAPNALGIDSSVINKRVKSRINAFYLACTQLGRREDVRHAIEYGMEIFNKNEDALVEIVNASGGNRSKRIRQYFTQLSQLPYKRIQMSTSQIMYVTELRQAPDGRWFGSAQIVQDFRGFSEGNVLAYIDRTNKTIKIELKTFTQEVSGRTVSKFEIYLSDIAVTNIH